jgi:FtsP/CotA-like multicopper oxidase with cupredoxin domain
MVNGELFSFPDKNPLVMEMGDIVQWTTDNGRSHPMHIHTQPFQLTSFNLSNQIPGTNLTNFFQVGSSGIACSLH